MSYSNQSTPELNLKRLLDAINDPEYVRNHGEDIERLLTKAIYASRDESVTSLLDKLGKFPDIATTVVTGGSPYVVTNDDHDTVIPVDASSGTVDIDLGNSITQKTVVGIWAKDITNAVTITTVGSANLYIPSTAGTVNTCQIQSVNAYITCVKVDATDWLILGDVA